MISKACSSSPWLFKTAIISFSALVSGFLGAAGGPLPTNLWNRLSAARAMLGTSVYIQSSEFHSRAAKQLWFLLSLFKPKSTHSIPKEREAKRRGFLVWNQRL